MNDYQHDRRLTVDAQDWAAPQPPKRRCPCGTILRYSNPENHCEVCKRKLDRGQFLGRSSFK